MKKRLTLSVPLLLVSALLLRGTPSGLRPAAADVLGQKEEAVTILPGRGRARSYRYAGYEISLRCAGERVEPVGEPVTIAQGRGQLQRTLYADCDDQSLPLPARGRIH